MPWLDSIYEKWKCFIETHNFQLGIIADNVDKEVLCSDVG